MTNVDHIHTMQLTSIASPTAKQLCEHVRDHRIRLPAMRLRETNAVVHQTGQVVGHGIRPAPVVLSQRDTGGQRDRGSAERDHLHVLASGRHLAEHYTYRALTSQFSTRTQHLSEWYGLFGRLLTLYTLANATIHVLLCVIPACSYPRTHDALSGRLRATPDASQRPAGGVPWQTKWYAISTAAMAPLETPI